MDLNTYIDQKRNELVKDTQQLLRIKSVQAPREGKFPFGGGVQNALEYVLNRCKEMGMKVKNLDNLAGHAEIGEGKELGCALVHVDVVPEGSGWDSPPYAAEIRDGKIYARGAIDDKGPAMATIYATKAVLDNIKNIKKRFRIIFGTNEETGWECVKHYFKNEETPSFGFTPDADFPLINAEKGIIVCDLTTSFKDTQNGDIVLESIVGGNAANMVPDFAEAQLKVSSSGKVKIEELLDTYNKSAKFPIELKTLNINSLSVASHGISTHGSTPQKGFNAIQNLIQFLEKCELSQSEAAQWIHFVAKSIAMELNGKSLGVAMSDKISGDLVFNLGKILMKPSEGRLTINIRYPVTSNQEEVFKRMSSVLEKNRVRIENLNLLDPLYVEENTELVQTLLKVYTDFTKTPGKPISIGGGTYARAMKNAVAFGPLLPGREELAHQKNENIAIDDLVFCAKIYAEAIRRLIS